MTEQIDVCGDCGAFKTFPSSLWKAVQSPAVAAWERQHIQDVHDGKQVSNWERHPNPVPDRD
jgi:hypothetical protein